MSDFMLFTDFHANRYAQIDIAEAAAGLVGTSAEIRLGHEVSTSRGRMVFATLSTDDEAGVQTLYPGGGSFGFVTGVVKRQSDSSGVSGAHVVAVDSDGNVATSTVAHQVASATHHVFSTTEPPSEGTTTAPPGTKSPVHAFCAIPGTADSRHG